MWGNHHSSYNLDYGLIALVVKNWIGAFRISLTIDCNELAHLSQEPKALPSLLKEEWWLSLTELAFRCVMLCRAFVLGMFWQSLFYSLLCQVSVIYFQSMSSTLLKTVLNTVTSIFQPLLSKSQIKLSVRYSIDIVTTFMVRTTTEYFK